MTGNEASEADARRLLYLALTLARDRLILEWPDFALKNLGESKGPANYAEMLSLRAGFEPEEGCLKVGEARFPARTLICSAEPPELPELTSSGGDQGHMAFGLLRPAIQKGFTQWRVRSSLITLAAARDIKTRLVALDIPASAIALTGTANERGSTLHKALRVLLMRPDLRPRLAGSTGLDETMLDALQEQAAALKTWRTAEGFGTKFFEYLNRDKGVGGQLTELWEVDFPDGLESIADFPTLTAAMQRANWSEAIIRKIMGENWLDCSGAFGELVN